MKKYQFTIMAIALFLALAAVISCDKKEQPRSAGIAKIDSTSETDNWIGNWEIKLVNTNRCNGKVVPGETTQKITAKKGEKGLQLIGPNRSFNELPAPMKQIANQEALRALGDNFRSFLNMERINIQDDGGNCLAMRWTNMLARLSKTGDRLTGVVYQGFIIPETSDCLEQVRVKYGPECLTTFDITGRQVAEGPQMPGAPADAGPMPVTSPQP